MKQAAKTKRSTSKAASDGFAKAARLRAKAAMNGAPAGYSGTPLVQKLGLKAGMQAAFMNAPPELFGYLEPLPQPLHLRSAPRNPMDFVMLFVSGRDELKRKLPGLVATLAPAGVLWLSWPKKASGVATDLTEDVLREVALPLGIVDVKVCAVDHTWSGLKFVIRRENR